MYFLHGNLILYKHMSDENYTNKGVTVLAKWQTMRKTVHKTTRKFECLHYPFSKRIVRPKRQIILYHLKTNNKSLSKKECSKTRTRLLLSKGFFKFKKRQLFYYPWL